MNKFLELLDTDLKLTVVINNQEQMMDLHASLEFDADHVVTVDGIDVLPRYRYLSHNGVLTISESFYRWYHQVAGHGWLLTPRQG